MTIHLSIVLFLPLATGLLGLLLPRGLARWSVLAGTVAVLAWSVVHGLAALWLSGSLDHAGRPFDELAGEVGALLGRSLAPRPGPADA